MFAKFKRIVKNAGKQKKDPRQTAAEYRKNGVRKFASDDEMLDAFGISDDLNEDAAIEKETAGPVKREVTDVAEKKVSRIKAVDKNGFPILDDAGDISKLMKQNYDEDAFFEKVAEESLMKRVVPEKSLKTRHGIPILRNDDDYASIFNDDDTVEDFNEILIESLGDKSTEVLLREKRDRVKPVKRITVKQRLSRYPLPQGQLDLHGYTAIKADLNVESYLKNAFHNGTYTVRIIVGKGLHSEDGPVLPDVIEKRVIQMKNEKIVFAYEWDKKKKSKSGSLTVYLNNYHDF